MPRATVAARSSEAAEKRKATAQPLPQTAFNPVWGRLAWGIQAKLAVSAPGDPAEQEADRMADTVMRMPEPVVQRKCAACSAGGATCPGCEEEERVQRKADGGSGAGEVESTTAPPSIRKGLNSPGQPLDQGTRSFMESRFGHDFSGVLLHKGSEAAESAQSIQARAYTIGRHIVFGSGAYAPATAAGKTLLAHELTHVVQQRGRPPSVARDVGFAGRGPISDPNGMGYNEIHKNAGPDSMSAVQALSSCEGPGMTFDKAKFDALPAEQRAAVRALRPHAAGTACAPWFDEMGTEPAPSSTGQADAGSPPAAPAASGSWTPPAATSFPSESMDPRVLKSPKSFKGNPPPPVGWMYWPEGKDSKKKVTPAGQRLAESAKTKEPGTFTQAMIDGELIGVRTEWHNFTRIINKTTNKLEDVPAFKKGGSLMLPIAKPAAPATPGVQRKAISPPLDGADVSVADCFARSGGRPFDAAERAYFEPRFGRDFRHVRIHADAGAADSAASLRARAYAFGNHIVFGAGEYRPGAAAGRRLVAHELAHVVQQQQHPGTAKVQREDLPNDPYPGTGDGEQPGLFGLSDEGFEFLKRHEGVKLKLYNDSQGHCTIGIGHLVHSGNCNGSESAKFKAGLTAEQVDELFKSDLQKFESAVSNGVTSRLNQYYFDALVSFAFNVGIPAFQGSGVLKEVNAKNYSKVPGEIMKWLIPPEIKSRRTDEANLFRTGKYS